MQTVVRVLLTLVLLVVAVFLGYDLARYYLYSPWTRDARVRANVVTVAPDVSGYVDDIRVRIINSCTRATCSSSSIRSVIDWRSQTPKPPSRHGMLSIS